jgi:hypothetical protein
MVFSLIALEYWVDLRVFPVFAVLIVGQTPFDTTNRFC